MDQSRRLDQADWLHLLCCLLLGCGLSFAALIATLRTTLEPRLIEETGLRTARSVSLVELALLEVPPSQLPPGVIVTQSLLAAEGPIQPVPSFDRKVQRHMASRYGILRNLQRDRPPYVETWGGVWIQLQSRYPSLWLYQPDRLSSKSVWFLPLARSAALLLGLGLGTVLFLKLRVENPFQRVLRQLPDGLPAPLPLLPEQGIAPLRVLSLRINRLLERLNAAGEERRQLLRGIVHDLAGPQTRIGLQIDLLREDLDPAHQGALQAIQSDLFQLAAMSQQLGLLADGELSTAPIHQLALDDFCLRVISSYVPEPIHLQVPRLLVRLEAAGLERALRNLIDNALDHGQPPVEIHAWGRQGTLLLEVKDHGHGQGGSNLLTMPRRSPSHDRERRRHRGLGLEIVERFCRQHQGALSITRRDDTFIAQMQLVATAEGPVVI